MKPAELAFLAIAMLIPLVFGGGLLYFLVRSNAAKSADRAPRDADHEDEKKQ